MEEFEPGLMTEAESTCLLVSCKRASSQPQGRHGAGCVWRDRERIPVCACVPCTVMPQPELVMVIRDFSVAQQLHAPADAADMSGDSWWCCRRFFVLTNTDTLWKEHLQAIKFIQQAVGLRGYAAKDPLIEFKLEG
eukprot:scaffold153282_cov17-Tisochrysis_lutea.AAC.1